MATLQKFVKESKGVGNVVGIMNMGGVRMRKGSVVIVGGITQQRMVDAQ